ncbi:Uncharacterised protein [Segatella copri]|nr:Uncharacterised protein [Segatella copri]
MCSSRSARRFLLELPVLLPLTNLRNWMMPRKSRWSWSTTVQLSLRHWCSILIIQRMQSMV